MVEPSAVTAHSPDRGHVAGMAARWGGIPLYLTVLLQGIPLGRSLMSTRSSLPEDAQQQLVDSVTTVGATQSLLPALVWGSVYLLAFFLLARKSSRAQLRHLMLRQWPLVALVVFAAFSVFWSPNIGKVLASSFHAFGIILVAMAAAIRCAAGTSTFVTALSFCFAVNLFIHLACVVAAPQIGVAIDGRWMGMATHSNSLGGIAWLGMWAAWIAMQRSTRKERVLLAASFSVAGIVLYGSGSATSIIAAFIGILIAAFLRVSGRWSRRSRMLANVFVVLAVAGSMVLISVVDSVIPAVTELFGKSPDFTGRGVIWEEAWRLISQHPVLGWGFDDNARVIVETGFIHSGYHNGYLDLAVRGGAASLGLFLLMCNVWFSGLTGVCRHWRMACISVGAAFLTYNFMEVSLFSPRNIGWVVLSAMAFSTVLLALKPKQAARPHSNFRSAP